MTPTTEQQPTRQRRSKFGPPPGEILREPIGWIYPKPTDLAILEMVKVFLLEDNVCPDARLVKGSLSPSDMLLGLSRFYTSNRSKCESMTLIKPGILDKKKTPKARGQKCLTLALNEHERAEWELVRDELSARFSLGPEGRINTTSIIMTLSHFYLANRTTRQSALDV